MKKLLSILFVLMCFNIKAQSDSILNKRLDLIELKLQANRSQVLQTQSNVESIQYNLVKFHNQWVKGMSFTIGGMFVSGIGIGALSIDNNMNHKVETGIIIGGGIISLVGTIIMIDSHKYINKAGLGIGSNGITYRFK